MSWICIGCSSENEDHVSVCPVCRIRHAAETTNGTRLFLHERNHDVKTEITDESCVVGHRERGQFSFLADEIFLSTDHFCITKRNNEWYVEHMSRTNPTLLNDMKLEHHIPMLLHNGDMISAGYLCFIVIIESEEPVEVEEKWQYVITCPKCGENYDVVDENSVIKECTSSSCSNDEVDKTEISSVRPVRKRKTNADR